MLTVQNYERLCDLLYIHTNKNVNHLDLILNNIASIVSALDLSVLIIQS